MFSITKVIFKPRTIISSYIIKCNFLKEFGDLLPQILWKGLQRCPTYICISQIGIVACLLIQWLHVLLNGNCKIQTACPKEFYFLRNTRKRNCTSDVLKFLRSKGELKNFYKKSNFSSFLESITLAIFSLLEKTYWNKDKSKIYFSATNSPKQCLITSALIFINSWTFVGYNRGEPSLWFIYWESLSW